MFLLFSSLVSADDISDFQIEGMSIKDSLLDFLSEKQIRNNTKDFYRTDDFIPVQIEGFYFNSEMYDVVEFNYKNGDKITIKSPNTINSLDSHVQLFVKNVKYDKEWSKSFIIFPKTMKETFNSYTLNDLNPDYKYRFGIIALGKNDPKKLDSYISDIKFIETKLQEKVINRPKVDPREEKVICQSDGTFNIYKGTDKEELKCNTSITNNLDENHDNLIEYLKPKDPIKLDFY